MRFEELKKEGIIEHPDKGNLDIVVIDGFVETNSIPELSRYAGTITQILTSNKPDVAVKSSESWIRVELANKSGTEELHTWNLNLTWDANETKDYRRADITITIGGKENIVEVIQKP